jgi:hypothetical protein
MTNGGTARGRLFGHDSGPASTAEGSCAEPGVTYEIRILIPDPQLRGNASPESKTWFRSGPITGICGRDGRLGRDIQLTSTIFRRVVPVGQVAQPTGKDAFVFAQGPTPDADPER